MSGKYVRHTANGAPWVNDPVKVTAKGRPARVLYGRPSNFGAQIENRFGIEKFNERHVLLGASLIDLTGVESLDPEDEVDRTQLDGLAVDAKKAAGAHTAARCGTLLHEITGYLDNAEEGVVGFVGLILEGRTGSVDPVVVTADMRGRDRCPRSASCSAPPPSG